MYWVVCWVVSVCGVLLCVLRVVRLGTRKKLVRRFKTSPRVGSKRFRVLAKRAHVEHMRALCRHTRKRFEPTHGDVLNSPTPVHTCKRSPRLLFLHQGNFVTVANGTPYSLTCGGQVPDVGLPHHRYVRMQHSQRTQPALLGVTTVVAPRGVPASTNEVFPASQRKEEKQRFLHKDKTSTSSTNDVVMSESSAKHTKHSSWVSFSNKTQRHSDPSCVGTCGRLSEVVPPDVVSEADLCHCGMHRARKTMSTQS